MEWNINFLTREEFKEHVKLTIATYEEKLKSIDLKEFNKNIIDPIKLIFDNNVYKQDWNETISNEIFRQRDKSNNNTIGYFHQNIFKYIKNCEVPNTGWDVIYRNESGIKNEDGSTVDTMYVEMKNKHNTMNSASSQKTYMKMQNQLLSDDKCICGLVEAIARNSQNIEWGVSLEGRRVRHNRIRRISIDKFYEIVTGEVDAFYKICYELSPMIEEIIEENSNLSLKEDTVIQELKNYDTNIILALFRLSFDTYEGFKA